MTAPAKRAARSLVMIASGVAILLGGCIEGAFSARGKVVTDSGRAIVGARVSAYQGDQQITAVSDERGCFVLFRMLSMPRPHQVPIFVLVREHWVALGTVPGPVRTAVPLKITVTNGGASEGVAVMHPNAWTDCSPPP